MEEEALLTIKYDPEQEKLGLKQQKLGHKQEKLGHHSPKMIQLNCSATKSLDKIRDLTKVRPRKVRTRDATPIKVHHTEHLVYSISLATR